MYFFIIFVTLFDIYSINICYLISLHIYTIKETEENIKMFFCDGIFLRGISIFQSYVSLSRFNLSIFLSLLFDL